MLPFGQDPDEYEEGNNSRGRSRQSLSLESQSIPQESKDTGCIVGLWQLNDNRGAVASGPPLKVTGKPIYFEEDR